MKINQTYRVVLVIFLAMIPHFLLLSQNSQGMIMQWGEFGDKPGQMKFPAMIAADRNSNIYVVDQHNHRIQKFDQDGNFILMWGRQGTGNGEFHFPYGIALDSRGFVYVTDMNNNRIQKFSPDGVFIGLTGSYGTDDGQMKYPYGIAVDKNDFIYVIDAFNCRVQKFDQDLRFISKWGSQESIGFRLYMPHEIAADRNGNIILSDRQNHRLSIFSGDGILIKRFGEFGEGIDAGGGLFSEPHGVAVNNEGDIFVCDRYNFRIQRFNSGGKYKFHWVTSGVPDDSRHFSIGIVAAPNGNIYITDHYSHCVQKY